jgi:hypothetical protein
MAGYSSVGSLGERFSARPLSLAVGFSRPNTQAHDELKSEFIWECGHRACFSSMTNPPLRPSSGGEFRLSPFECRFELWE